MKAFLSAIIVATAVAVAAAYMLDGGYQQSAYEVFTSSGSRVGDPGNNLVTF